MLSPPKEQWFVAVLVYESSINDAWSDTSIDVQYRLIRATDVDTAYERGLALGKRLENAYENPFGQTCIWSFKGLEDLQMVTDDTLGHGVEVYGFTEPGTAEDRIVLKAQLTAFRGGQND